MHSDVSAEEIREVLALADKLGGMAMQATDPRSAAFEATMAADVADGSAERSVPWDVVQQRIRAAAQQGEDLRRAS